MSATTDTGSLCGMQHIGERTGSTDADRVKSRKQSSKLGRLHRSEAESREAAHAGSTGLEAESKATGREVDCSSTWGGYRANSWHTCKKDWTPPV